MTNPAAVEGGGRAARRRLDPERSRALILDATERLMQREGYGAVTSRSVAVEAGLKPPLVHYYYRTTDELLLAYYRRSAARSMKQLEAALASAKPLTALWTMLADPARTAMAAEFVALANHRKTIAAEMANNVAIARRHQLEIVRQALARVGIVLDADGSAIVTVILASIGYGLVLERQIGADEGHEETRRFVEGLVARIEP